MFVSIDGKAALTDSSPGPRDQHYECIAYVTVIALQYVHFLEEKNTLA